MAGVVQGFTIKTVLSRLRSSIIDYSESGSLKAVLNSVGLLGRQELQRQIPL